MKKILIKILIITFSFGLLGTNYISNTYAADQKGSGVTTIVTEKIPGAGCKKIEPKGETQKYECTIGKGFSSVISSLGSIIKYFTFIASIGAVLFIILNAIMYSMGGADPSMKDDAKKRIIGTLVGLILLLLSGVILNAIAPWIYK